MTVAVAKARYLSPGLQTRQGEQNAANEQSMQRVSMGSRIGKFNAEVR
jgi:hypothetical protein